MKKKTEVYFYLNSDWFFLKYQVDSVIIVTLYVDGIHLL